MLDRRNVLLGAAIGFVASGPVLADERTALRDTLLATEIESWRFVREKNVEGMRGYMADGGFEVFSDGTRYSKAEFLRIMPDFDFASFTVDNAGAELLPVAPDVATLMYRVTYTSALKGTKPQTGTVLACNTYVRRNGRWQSLLYQETPAK